MLTVLAVSFVLIAQVQAQTRTWVLSGTGNFDDDANWSGGVVPQTNDSIVIENGGTVQSSYSVDVANVSIGGGSTYAVLPGINSYFSPDSVYLGTSGTGTLTIGSQALVAAASNLYLGYGSGSTGVVSLDNATLSPFTTYIGYAGSGTMTLVNGSTLQSTIGYVGYQAGSQGQVNLNNSTWKAEDGGLPVDITVGVNGAGEIQATSSQISASNFVISSSIGSTGEVNLSGGTLSIENSLQVGNAGTGTLSLSGAASAEADGVSIGTLANSTGQVSLTNSFLTSTEAIFVGLSGNGTLEADGGHLVAPELFIGRNNGASGSVTFSSGTLALTGEIHVGAQGNGTFTLQDGGIMNTDKGNMGFSAGQRGVVNVVSGHWTNTQAVFVGVSGTGTLNIATEGLITSESGYIGQNASGTGKVNLNGGTWEMSNTLAVGVNGNGEFSANGGTVSSQWAQVGLHAGSSGTVTVSNANWTTGETLTIGSEGDGEFYVTNGANVTAGSIELAASAGSTGFLSVANATVTTENILAAVGPSSLSLAGARINLLGGSSVLDTLLIDGFASGAVVVGAGGLTVDTQGGNAQIVSVLSGSGSLTKEGAGRLRLTTANTVSGGSFINGGALEIANDLALGDGDVALTGGELRAFTNTTLSGNLSSGIQLISVSANQTGTFSAVNGQTLTLSPLDFLLSAGSTMRVGSAGYDGTVVFAPTGAVALPADAEISVDYGTLQAGNSALLFMANIADSVTVAAGATLDFNDQVSGGAVGNLQGGGTVRIGSSPDSVLVVNSGSFSGSILGTGNLAKQTSGTLILSGSNTLTGETTVSGGTLVVDGFLGIGTVEIQAGGTLGGNGTIAQISLNGGTLAPGSSAGTLTTGELLWYDGVMLFELGPSSDHLVAEGLQGFGGPYYFTFADLGWTEGTTYDLITVDGPPIDFDLADIQYTNSGGFSGTFAFENNVLQFTLHTIPEPTTGVLVLLAGALALRRRRGSALTGPVS